MSTFVRSMPRFVPLLVFERGSAYEHSDSLGSAEVQDMETALKERFGMSRPRVELRVRDGSVLQPGSPARDGLGGISIPNIASEPFKSIVAHFASFRTQEEEDPDVLAMLDMLGFGP